MEREGKGQVAEGLGGQEVAASVVPWLCHGASGRFGRCWSVSAAYGLGSRVHESRYGTPGFGVLGVLRTGPRGGSGAGV